MVQEQYGDGYTLTVTAAVDQPVDSEGIERLITQHVPEAGLARFCGGELVFRLPTAAAASTALPDLLDTLETEGASRFMRTSNHISEQTSCRPLQGPART